MNYELLFAESRSPWVRVALTGAAGGFARSLLLQCRTLPALEIVAVCDLDLSATAEVLAELGYAHDAIHVCRTGEQVREAADAGKIILAEDYTLLDELPIDIVVEATGNPEVSLDIASRALRREVSVVMVTKETDSVAGPWLGRLAREHGVVYTTANGDQPGNLIGLYTWARLLGLEVVAAGKSSEYDYVFDHETETVRHTGAGETRAVSELAALWRLGPEVPETLTGRRRAISGFPQSAAPDCCEMNVVANSTGLLPADDGMAHPLCRVSELADVFIPAEDGGILTRDGELAVFNCLRRPDEASFAGGVFVVVRCADRVVWQTLREKGHVVSRSGAYAAVYLPYHLMGIETPISLFSAVLHERPTGARDLVPRAIMIARAERDFEAGEVLRMGGHHHEIDGIGTRLLPATEATARQAPFYLAANKRLSVDVPAGSVITTDMLDLTGSDLAAVWRETLAMPPRNA